MLYAVVDIETTGGFASGNGITEIAILIHDGISVIDKYETLINPGLDIPPYIEALTGINNFMVRKAPFFHEIAEKVFNLLNEKIFVAHNVNFDFSFLKFQLNQCGFNLQSRKLCTVRLSRKLFPGHNSYSLGKLCNALNISLNNRHRAGGDAAATADLLTLLLESDHSNILSQTLSKISKEQTLPPNLGKSEIDKLPSSPGVYYFKDEKGIAIYVGKAKNIKKRVCSHFSGTNTGRQRQNFLKEIHSIDFEICGTELMAFILEATEIKRLWPAHNRAMKEFEQKYGLYAFTDQKGYIRLGIDKYKKNTIALFSFNTILEGYNLLKVLVKDHLLCEKLCFIQKSRTCCTAHEVGNCAGACVGKESAASYNVRVKYAMDALKLMLPSFALIDNGRTDDEQSCLLVEQGIFYGMGYISQNSEVDKPETLKSALTPLPSNDYILHMILSHVNQFPEKKITLSSSISSM